MADFKEALQRARNMIHNDAKQDAHIIKERVADRNQAKFFRDQPNDAFSSISSFDVLKENNQSDADSRFESVLDSMSSQLTNSVSSKMMNQVPSSSVLKNIKNSKMPKAILESLAENYIDQSKLADGYANALENISNDILSEDTVKEKQTPIRETVIQQPQNIGVDYSLIKSIVEECMRKYASSITKKVLAEQKNFASSAEEKLKAIRIGESFSFITSNGDLYEAELKFKKNLKKGN